MDIDCSICKTKTPHTDEGDNWRCRGCLTRILKTTVEALGDNEITITMSVEEFAVFIDCEPTIYNRLSPEQRKALRDAYDGSVSGRTALWYTAMDKLTEVAKATF